VTEEKRDKSAEEREKDPVAPEEISHEKRERAIGRRRFMGLTFKAVVGGVGLTLFAQTRDAHANCTSYNVCDTEGENACATYNSCTGAGTSNQCSAGGANICEEIPSAGEYNLCADSAANSCTAGSANLCYDDSDNSCRTGSTNTCSGTTADACYSGSTNECGEYSGGNACSGTNGNRCEDAGTSNVCGYNKNTCGASNTCDEYATYVP